MLAEVQIVKHYLDRFLKGLVIWQQVTPFAGDDGVQHVNQTIDCKEPHEEKMQSHAVSETMADSQEIEKAIGEELK